MHLPSSTITFVEAKERGYRPLTMAFILPNERHMLDSVQRDLDKDRIDYVLAGSAKHPEIWRKGLLSMTETAAPKIPLDASRNTRYASA